MPAALILDPFGGHPCGEAALASAVDAVGGRPGWQPVVVSDAARPADGVRTASTAALPVEAARADALLVVGGCPFAEIAADGGRAPSALLQRAAGAARTLWGRRKPVLLVDVAAQPLLDPRARRTARALVAHSEAVVARDEASAAALRDLGIDLPHRVGGVAGGGLRAVVPTAADTAQRALVRSVVARWLAAQAAPAGDVIPLVRAG